MQTVPVVSPAEILMTDAIHVFITLIDLKTAIYGCTTLYEKELHLNVVFTVSFIPLMLVTFFDNPKHSLVM
jgi:hypothetical protein